MASRTLYLIQSEYFHYGLSPITIHTHRLKTLLEVRLFLLPILAHGENRVGYFHDSIVEAELGRWKGLLNYGSELGDLPQNEFSVLTRQLYSGRSPREALEHLALQRYVSGRYTDYDMIKTIAALSELRFKGTDVSLKPSEKHHPIYEQAELRKLLSPESSKVIREIATRKERSVALFRELVQVRSAFIIEHMIMHAEKVNMAFMGIDHVLTDIESIPDFNTHRILIIPDNRSEGVELHGELPEKFQGMIPSKTANNIPVDDAIMYVED